MFCKVFKNKLFQCLHKEQVVHKGQAGFRINWSCMDNIYTLNELIIQGIIKDKQIYALFLK